MHVCFYNKPAYLYMHMYKSLSDMPQIGEVLEVEGFLGIQGYWSKTLRDMGYFCKYLMDTGCLDQF